MAVLGCYLLIVGCCEQFLGATTALVMCGIQSMCNSLLVTMYSWCQFLSNRNNYHIIIYEVSYESLYKSEINSEKNLT